MRLVEFTSRKSSAPLGQHEAQEKGKVMTVNKITSVLFAAEIEPCLNFWAERFGFKKTIEVPEGNHLAFAILQKTGAELMYQTYASAENDVSAVSPEVRKGPSFLYVEVENLDEILPALKGAEIVMPVRTTFYGAREIAIKDLAGHLITFAQLGVAPQQ
jgi:uncharacterized glyoxalase superfamily protein PhnB